MAMQETRLKACMGRFIAVRESIGRVQDLPERYTAEDEWGRGGTRRTEGV